MLVTIITPTYNRADLLPETIESILAQDYPSIEYLVLDDGSTDDTQAVLKRYGDRIKTAHHSNMGETATVNRGFDLATGDLVCVVSSDDPLLPGAVRRMVEAFDAAPDALAAYPDWAEIGPRGEFLRTQRLPEYDFRSMIRSRSWGIGPGAFFRRSGLQLVGKRNPALVYCGDMEFWARMAMRGRLIHVPRVLATHRVHAGSASVSQRGNGLAREWVGVWHALLYLPGVPGDIVAQRRDILRATNLIAARTYCGNDRWSAWRLRADALLPWLLEQAITCAKRVLRWLRTALPRRMRPALRRLALAGFALMVWLARRRLAISTASAGSWLNSTTSRFAVCTRFVPPLWSGQAVVLGRLLAGFPTHTYCLVSLPLYPGKPEHDFTDALPAKRLLLPEELSMTQGSGWSGLPRRLTGRFLRSRLSSRPWMKRFAHQVHTLGLLYKIWQRGCNMAAALRTERVDTVVGCSGDLLDAPAAYVASRILGAKMALYLFDDYAEQWWADPPLKRLVARLERFIALRCWLLLSPNEFMQKELQLRYGRKSAVVRNPRAAGTLPAAITAFPAHPPEVSLVFTGAVYHLNYDVLRSVVAALATIHEFPARLHIYTAQPPEELEHNGLSGPHVVIHAHVPPGEAAEVQRRADILLIPFSFLAEARGIIRTAATAKLADYLAAGRPILALCPQDCFLAWYLQQHECGVVLSTDAPHRIAQVLRSIVADADLRSRLQRNALRAANTEFDPQVAQAKLKEALNLTLLPDHLCVPAPKPQPGKLRVTHLSGYDLLGIQVNGFLLHKYLHEHGHPSSMVVYGKVSSDASVHELGGRWLRRLNWSVAGAQRLLGTHAMLVPFSYQTLHSRAVREADIVHLHLAHNAPFFSMLHLPRLSRRTHVVLSVHDMFFMTGHCIYSFDCNRWQTGCGRCPDLDIPFPLRHDTTAFNWKLKRNIFARSKLDIVIGSQWQEERVRASPILSRFPIHRIPYGIDTRIFKVGDRSAARARFGIPDDAHVVAFRSVPFSRNFKGTEFIEAALAAYMPGKRTFLLTFEAIGGLDRLREKYEFVELGWVTDQELIAQGLRAADIFLMPSVAEAFGLMAIESMACGTPVIVFEGTALPETIDAPRSGIAVPYKDSTALAEAIAACLSNPAYLAQLRENGLRHVEAKHTFEAYANGYLALYERIARDAR